MMKIPKGKPVHKELSSSFVDLEKLLEEMDKSGFSGLIELVGVRSECEILVEDGTACNARIARGDNIRIGRSLLNEIIHLSHQDNLLISTYQLPPDMVVLVSSFLGSERIYENLSAEFTDPNKLITKFENEGGNYFIEVLFQKNLGSGMLFIHDGQLVDGLLSLLGKNLTQGQAAIQGICEGARELGAVFNVYQGEIGTEIGAARADTPSAGELEDVFSVLIGEFETVISEGGRKKLNFNSFLRECCLAMAEKHPFLDPFAAEFEYHDGRVTLHSQEDADALARGVFDLLQAMISRLREMDLPFPSDEYPQNVTRTLEEKHSQTLASLQLDEYLNLLQ